jgi:DNA-binding XRE family transcriptional regulator
MVKIYTHEKMKNELFKNKNLKRLFKQELNKLAIAHQIAEMREKNCMTQAELAKRLHTRQQVVSRLEQDNYKTSISTLEKIAIIFGKHLEIRFV